MSDNPLNESTVALLKIMAFLADLEAWYRLPWYQRLMTPKPQMPQ